MNITIFTNYGEFVYPNKESLIKRFHFLCWWMEFYHTTKDFKHYVTISDQREYKELKDYLRGEHNDRVFSPKSVFDYYENPT
jgi:hypothetical protein